MISIVWIDNLDAVYSVVLLNSDHTLISLTKVICFREVDAHVHTSTLMISCSLREWLFDTHALEADITSRALVQLFPEVSD